MSGRIIVAAFILQLMLSGCASTSKVAGPVGSQEEITKTVIAPAGSEMAEQMLKQEQVFDKKGRLLRIVHYLSEKASKERGYATQADIYDGLAYPTKFIMTFTPEMQKEKGFIRRIDTVDERDTLLSVRFDLSDSEGFIANDIELKELEKFPIHSIGSYVKYHEPVDRPNAYIIEAPLWGGTCYVQYSNSIEDIGPEELSLIARWSGGHGAGDWEKNYSKKILVREKDNLMWICLQDSLVQYLKNNGKMVLQYYYIGASFEGPTFLAIYIRVVD
jgi:hypothetical protein